MFGLMRHVCVLNFKLSLIEEIRQMQSEALAVPLHAFCGKRLNFQRCHGVEARPASQVHITSLKHSVPVRHVDIVFVLINRPVNHANRRLRRTFQTKFELRNGERKGTENGYFYVPEVVQPHHGLLVGNRGVGFERFSSACDSLCHG